MSQEKPVTWESLNARQRFYLEAIFDEDQRTEANFRWLKAMGLDTTPASVWRWLPYNTGGEVLQKKFEAHGMRDEGTGATLEALKKRRLVLLNYAPGSHRTPIIYIQITKQGRALVRKAFGLQAPKTVPGTLREWHWRALAYAYQQGEQGIEQWPRGIGDRTVRRLEEYKIEGEVKPLIEWGERACEPYLRRNWPGFDDVQATTRAIRKISAFGRQYYRENWVHYKELYPGIHAPEP
jgi:hypothetical protein